MDAKILTIKKKNILQISKYLDYRSCINLTYTNKTIKSHLRNNLINIFDTQYLQLSNKDLNKYKSKDNLIYEILNKKNLKENISIIKIQFETTLKNSDLYPISKYNNLKEIIINGCHGINDDYFKLFKNELKITLLELYWMPQIKDIAQFLSIINKELLIYLNLSGCKNLLKENFNLILEFSNLESLDLTRCTSLTDDIIYLISKKNKNIKKLILYAIPYLKGNFLSNLSNKLESLDICGNQVIVDHDICSLKSQIIKHINLVSLDYNYVIKINRLGAIN